MLTKASSETTSMSFSTMKNLDIQKKINFAFLLLFLFFLPLYEAPKNIFSALFVLIGIWIAFKENTASRLTTSQKLVFCTLTVTAVSPFIAGIGSPYLDLGDRVAGALNWALMPLVAITFLLVDSSERQVFWAIRAVCLGATVATVQAFYQWTGEYPELNSVGHVNQSALFLSYCLVPAFLLLNRKNQLDFLLSFGTCIAVFCYLGPSKSMVAFGVALIICGSFWITFCINQKYFKSLVATGLAGITLLIASVNLPASYFGPYEGFKREFDVRLSSKHDPFSQRDRLVNTALAVAGDSLTGFGLGSFGAATQLQNIRHSVESRGEDWSSQKTLYSTSTHGHNIFANVLVERGWVGVFTIGAFFLAMGVVFIHRLKTSAGQVGLIVISSVLVSGLGQSALHVEHGQLAFILIAVCLKNLNFPDRVRLC